VPIAYLRSGLSLVRFGASLIGLCAGVGHLAMPLLNPKNAIRAEQELRIVLSSLAMLGFA
jgi:hypothetical protein